MAGPKFNLNFDPRRWLAEGIARSGLADALADVVTMTGAIAASDWRASDTHRFSKTFVPGQNLIYLRRLLDEVEQRAIRAICNSETSR
jgi:hypothetical protein